MCGALGVTPWRQGPECADSSKCQGWCHLLLGARHSSCSQQRKPWVDPQSKYPPQAPLCPPWLPGQWVPASTECPNSSDGSGSYQRSRQPPALGKNVNALKE